MADSAQVPTQRWRSGRCRPLVDRTGTARRHHFPDASLLFSKRQNKTKKRLNSGKLNDHFSRQTVLERPTHVEPRKKRPEWKNNSLDHRSWCRRSFRASRSSWKLIQMKGNHTGDVSRAEPGAIRTTSNLPFKPGSVHGSGERVRKVLWGLIKQKKWMFSMSKKSHSSTQTS